MTSAMPEWLSLRVRAVRTHLPAAFREAALELPEVERWCDHLLEGRTSSLLLLGGVGTGKTGNAWAAWPYLVSRGWTGAWRAVTEQGYLDALLPDGDRAVAVRSEHADLLLLDDVGTVAVSDWSRARMFALLDARWTQRRPTILTTNLTTHRLGQHLGERATSRLGQDLVTVSLTGADRRTA